MLTELFVKNYAIIDELRLQFGGGFSVLSGETGAGKSILVGALSLILGGKATPAVVRTGESETIIEAVFDISQNQPIKKILEEAGLEDEDQLVIRRHVFTQGKNKIYINGRAVTLSQLEVMAPLLVDLSGQHDQQMLLHEENHRAILDSNEKINPLLSNYGKTYQEYQTLKDDFDRLVRLKNERESKLEFIHFQLKEIKKANIKDGNEEKDLLIEKTRVKNADKLFELAKTVSHLVSDADDAILVQTNSLSQQIQKSLPIDDSLNEALTLISQAQAPLEELGRFFESYLESLKVEPGRLNEIESRLFEFHQLKKKFGDSLSAVCEKEKSLEEELKLLENYDESLLEKEKALKKIEKEVLEKAKALSDTRKKMARNLEARIQKELTGLSMPKVVFCIHVDTPQKPGIQDCSPQGYNDVHFDIAPNVGETPKPLSKIASGGELSRVLLAIKQVLGTSSQTLTFIFDEIDSGIGGAVAEVVGKKIKQIAENHQVLCVTHLPQIATCAQNHFVIEKGVKSQRTYTEVRLLEGPTREEEIARMLGGVQITDKTREHAKEMIRAATS